MGALEGLKVLDVTQHLAGPYCSMILGDLGADVIKIEKPGGGDDARDMPPFVNGESAPFMMWNRNKRGIVLDLKSAAGRKTFHAMALRADVVVENFRPGVAEKLGIGYAALREMNTRLVYCSISGFGQTGPYRDRGGFDLIIQAMSGLMAVCGEVNGPPFRLPIAISDLAAGMFGAIGILAALQARGRTGNGQLVDVGLFDSATALGVYEAAHYFSSGKRPPRLGQAHRGSSPYQIFPTQDGWLALGGGTQQIWERICKVVDCPELVHDPRFATNTARVANNESLVAILETQLARQTTAYWLAQFDAHEIPVGHVMAHDELYTDPQVQAREMVVEVDHARAGRTKTLGTPIKLSGTPASIRRTAPAFGEHTAEILGELGR
jgi:crotonobetainyl-CoA:carnitine CoA-transferase CaiB-like acyl-CoA transferase